VVTQESTTAQHHGAPEEAPVKLCAVDLNAVATTDSTLGVQETLALTAEEALKESEGWRELVELLEPQIDRVFKYSLQVWMPFGLIRTAQLS
jgi:hypothetical protein